MRGLKPGDKFRVKTESLVASFTDAWIETDLRSFENGVAYVASFTDAWIETAKYYHIQALA